MPSPQPSPTGRGRDKTVTSVTVLLLPRSRHPAFSFNPCAQYPQTSHPAFWPDRLRPVRYPARACRRKYRWFQIPAKGRQSALAGVFLPERADPAHQITRGALRNHWVCHIYLFRSQRFGHFLQIQLPSHGRDRDGEMLHIAIHGHQQRFIDRSAFSPSLRTTSSPKLVSFGS